MTDQLSAISPGLPLGKTLPIDCGRGTTQRLLQTGLRLGQVDALFITHLHSDRIVGIPDLWLTGWLGIKDAQHKGPFVVQEPADFLK